MVLMIRLLATVGLLISAAVLVADAPAAGRTALTITYWEDGREPETKIVRTLRCNPVGGTLPTRTASCRKLARYGTSLFKPTPKGVACTQIYGGPQKAIVSGVVNGTRVRTTFTKVNGCEIDRWKRMHPILWWGWPAPK